MISYTVFIPFLLLIIAGYAYMKGIEDGNHK